MEIVLHVKVVLFYNHLLLSHLTFIVYSLQHRIRKSCTWGYKHALVILGLKLG
jgi:hypothetical protein